MGRQHIRDGLLYVRQQKTGAELAIPVHADFEAIIAESAAGQMTFLVTEFGKPFTAAGFGNWFREQCDMANLRPCSAHGCARPLLDGCRGRLHRARDRGDHRARQLARDHPLYESSGSEAPRGGSYGEGESGTSSVKPVAGFDEKRRKL